VRAFQESFENVKKVYQVFGSADRLDQEIFEGEHAWHGVRGIPFLARHLGV
jgi:hypothetical protein